MLSEQDQALYAAIRNNLKHIVPDLKSAHCTTIANAVDAALSIFRAAVADFAEERNHTAPSLPSELLVECFARLPLRDRVVASLVSRGWRALILASPTLWTDVSCADSRAYDMPAEVAISRFRELIARSGSAPLDVRWSAYSVSSNELDYELDDDVRALFGESMSRIRTLSIGDYPDLDFFSTLQAPLLESLELIRPFIDTPCLIPVRWINDCAPRLRRLSVGVFHFPDAQSSESGELVSPMRTIEVFSGRLDTIQSELGTIQGESAARELFAWFPCLRSLTLTGLSGLDVKDLPQLLPPTVSQVELVTREANEDFSSVLRDWAVLPSGKNRTITLNTDNTPAVAHALQYLSAPAATTGIEMRCDCMCRITLSVSGDNRDLTVILHAPYAEASKFPSTLCGSLHLGIIRSLVLDGVSLIDMLRAKLNFYGLHSLTISDRATLTPRSAIIMASNAAAPPLLAPALREITFNLTAVIPAYEKGGRWGGPTASRLAEFIGSHVQSARDGLKLEKVTIVQQERPAWQDVSGLLVYVRKIYYGDSANPTRSPEHLFGPPDAMNPSGPRQY